MLLTTVCGIASCSTLVLSVSGQFSSTDVAGPLVAPNGQFNFEFSFDSNPTPVTGTITSTGFDLPLADFNYTLNNSRVNANPSEIRFNTAGNGGLFDVTFGSGFSAASFDFQGIQAYSGTTASPVFTNGNYSVSSWTYSDPANFDSQTPTALAATIANAPEPSSITLAFAGISLFAMAGIRKLKGAK